MKSSYLFNQGSGFKREGLLLEKLTYLEFVDAEVKQLYIYICNYNQSLQQECDSSFKRFVVCQLFSLRNFLAIWPFFGHFDLYGYCWICAVLMEYRNSRSDRTQNKFSMPLGNGMGQFSGRLHIQKGFLKVNVWEVKRSLSLWSLS